MLSDIIEWVLSHKKVVFLYVPMAVMVLLALYTGVIYFEWQGDRDAAMTKLAKYKRLIDHTEELREGVSYSYSDIDLSAKVVDIPTRIYDRNNEVIGEFFEQKREIVPYGSIPRWLIKAVVASEDRDFYSHHGISTQGILRAFIVNIMHFRVVQGGSTITQQLAKVLFTNMDRSLKRKIYEAFCAVEIEKRYDKQDILSMYLNLIYFGNGAYGVEAASKMFFGQSVKDLNETECALIVATISNPVIYSPLGNLENALLKTRRIMKSTVDAGFIKKQVADYQFRKFLGKWDVVLDEKGRAKTSLIGSFLYSSYRVNRAPFFNEGIRRILSDRFGEDVVKKGGLSVYTTIDGAKQDVAEKLMKDGILNQREYHLKTAEKIRNPKKAGEERDKAGNIEGALVSLNPYNGEMIAYVGGYSFSSRNQMDHVSQVRRQPGSSFKPIVYAAAVENKDINPSMVMIDEKTTFKGNYAPRNYDNQYLGKVIVREALKKSINIVAVKVLDKTGYDTVFRILRDGLDLSEDELNKRFYRTLSLALGTYEVSPLENCVLHSLILNGGLYIKPYGIKIVKDYNGNVVWNNEEDVKAAVEENRKRLGRIINPAAGAVTVDMLKGVFEEGGTASFAVKGKKINFPIAGKTGTTSNFNDAWFVGYTADMVTAVWIGNKMGAISLGSGRAGGVIPASVWANLVSRVYRDETPGDFLVPQEGVTKQSICIESGLVPVEGACPFVAVNELFLAGTEPGKYCTIHTLKEKE